MRAPLSPRISPLLVLPILLFNAVLRSHAAEINANWTDTEIGTPEIAGSHQMADGAFTITGSGTGDSNKDQLHFSYRTLPAGDVVMVARLTALTGEPGKGRAGIMLRDGLDPAASMALIGAIVPKGDDLGFYFRGRVAGSRYLDNSAGSNTILKMPAWIKLSRIGNDFGVYRSQDGKLWSQVHNASGGVFRATGPVQLGFFAAGVTPKTSVTATFDSITIGKPRPAYRSSWIGNNFGQASTGGVSNGTSALWVGPDGTCLTNSPYDEAGEASKIYRDGKVIKSFRQENEALGNSSAAEGSITGSGNRTFLACGKSIFQSDMLAQASATRPMYFAHKLWDSTRNINATSGMVVVKDQLYLSDSMHNKILVAALENNQLYKAGNTSVNQTEHAIDTAGVANAAPEAVYQSQRENDSMAYQIPGLDPKETYTVRGHFALLADAKPGQWLIDFYAGGQRAKTFDLLAEGGGLPYKAIVKEITGAKTDAKGTLVIDSTRGAGGGGHQTLCGFEVLKADGTVAFAVNCGGPAIGAFQSEVNEIPERAFDFSHPGPMTADKRGNLWIIQQAGDFPLGVLPTSKYPAAIKCYRTDGTFTGKQITDLVNPTGVAYDAKVDRLLVAENGPDQNIRGYAGLAGTPALDKTFAQGGTFGIKGGIYAGKVPGRLFDAAAGGAARFYGLSGVGVDDAGNLYVACNSSGTDLRKYTPDGKLLWMLNSLHFVDCADFDQSTDGVDVYTPFKSYTMDYAKTAPGSEWKYTSYNWNPFKYGAPPRSNSSSAVFRRLGPKGDRVMFTSGQGQVGYAGIFRFEGDIAVPCGRVESKAGKFDLWIDANGDGIETPDEVNSSPAQIGISSFGVDNKGDIWLACMGGASQVLRHYRFKGLGAHGVPLYGNATTDFEDIPFPGTGSPVSSWGQFVRVVYDSDRDAMYLLGPAVSRKRGEDDPLNYLARYDNWSKGNRVARWLINLPNPTDDPNFVYPSVHHPYNLAYGWTAMDVATDKVFISEMYGPVHAYDAETGKLDILLVPGPEVSGSGAWEDENMGVRAYKRKDGEYVVFTENSGWGGRNNMFRWKPTPKPAP